MSPVSVEPFHVALIESPDRLPVIVPEPVPAPAAVTVNVFKVNVAVTVVVPSISRFTVHWFPFVELQPDQEVKFELASGVAVNVTLPARR